MCLSDKNNYLGRTKYHLNDYIINKILVMISMSNSNIILSLFADEALPNILFRPMSELTAHVTQNIHTVFPSVEKVGKIRPLFSLLPYQVALSE